MRRFAIPVLYAALLLLWCGLSHCAIVSNDVFPLRWQADHLSFHIPATFYDGFFPIGYPLLERFVALTGNPILMMMLLQVALSAIYVFYTQRVLEKLAGSSAALLALPVILFSPQILTNVLSATPDFLAGFCVLIALWLLVRKEDLPESFLGARSNRFFFAGIALGFAYLLRTHVIILTLALAIGIVFFERPRIRSCVFLLLGTVPFVLLQGLVQVWSGHGFFESAQAFNIWRMMYGSNWGALPNLRGMSSLEVVRVNPMLFFSAWWQQIVSEWLYLVPTILAFILLLPQGRIRSHRLFAEFLLASILYLIVSAAGGSPRNVVVIIPVVAAAPVFVIEVVFRRLSWSLLPLARMGAIVLWVFGVVSMVIFALHAAARVNDYREVEQLLHVHSTADAAHVFSEDFDLYFPDLNYATPRTSGGWAEIGLPEYAQQFPSVPDSSAEVMHAALKREGIGWAVFRMPPYDPRAFRSAESDSALFRYTYGTMRHNIYRVE